MTINNEPDNYPRQELYECDVCGKFKPEDDFPRGGVVCEDCETLDDSQG